MRVLVHSNPAGEIVSVAILNPKLGAQLHMQTDDDGEVRALDIDVKAIARADLAGEKGIQAQQRAYQRLHKLMPRK